jgi:hypothetical protein
MYIKKSVSHQNSRFKNSSIYISLDFRTIKEIWKKNWLKY